jgi:hypothetical protein
VDDFHVNLDDQARTPLALIFTDSHGRVISIHGQLMDMMHFDDPGTVVGEPLHIILGIDYNDSKYLVDNVAQNGSVLDWALEIHPHAADPIPVSCTSVPTFNDKGDFIGSDITLSEQAHLAAEVQPTGHEDTLITRILQVQAGVESEEEQAPLQLYVTVQFGALHILLARLAGLRVSKTLETTINKTADKKDWPLSIQGDRLLLAQDEVPADVYRALMDETVRFVANIIGRRTVAAEMRAVDERMSRRAVELAQDAGLRHLFSESGSSRSAP